MVEMAELPWVTPAGEFELRNSPPGESRAEGRWRRWDSEASERRRRHEPLEVVQGTDPWAGCAALCVCVRVLGCVGV